MGGHVREARIGELRLPARGSTTTCARIPRRRWRCSARASAPRSSRPTSRSRPGCDAPTVAASRACRAARARARRADPHLGARAASHLHADGRHAGSGQRRVPARSAHGALADRRTRRCTSSGCASRRRSSRECCARTRCRRARRSARRCASRRRSTPGGRRARSSTDSRQLEGVRLLLCDFSRGRRLAAAREDEGDADAQQVERHHRDAEQRLAHPIRAWA